MKAEKQRQMQILAEEIKVSQKRIFKKVFRKNTHMPVFFINPKIIILFLKKFTFNVWTWRKFHKPRPPLLQVFVILAMQWHKWSMLWNALPDDVRAAPSVATFRRRVKTYLYNKAYPPYPHSIYSIVFRGAWPLLRPWTWILKYVLFIAP